MEMEEGSRKRRWLMVDDVNSVIFEKKLRPSSIPSLLRKRPRSEVTETDAKEVQDTSSSRDNSVSVSISTDVSHIGSIEKKAGGEDKLVQNSERRKFRRLGRTMQGPGDEQLGTGNSQNCNFILRKSGVPEDFEHKNFFSDRSFRGHDSSGDRKNSSEESKMGEQNLMNEHEVLRKVLQTVRLAEDKKLMTEKGKVSVVLNNDNAGMVSSLEKTALSSRDKKRRVADWRDSSPPRQPEKRSCNQFAIWERPPGAVEQGLGTSTWKRLNRDYTRSRPAASEDLRVSVSEDWKRLREEGVEHSGSPVNERSDSDLSMSTIELEAFEERLKKARHDPSLPLKGEKWTMKIRQKEETNSRKRILEHNVFETSSNLGSDIVQLSYLDNRRWKRPRFENLISVQGRSWRRHNRDVKEAQECSGENSRKRFQPDESEKSVKKQRK